MASVSSTSKNDGLSPAQIKALIALREESLQDVGSAEGVKEDPKRISDTIERRRRNERIRRKLCTYLNLPYEKLWGEGPVAQKADGREAVRAA